MRCFSLCTAPQYGAIPDMWHFLFATVCLGHRRWWWWCWKISAIYAVAQLHSFTWVSKWTPMQCNVVKCTALQCIPLRTPFSLHRLDHKVNYGDWQGAAGKSGDQMEEVPFPRMKHRHGRWLYIEQVAEVWGTTLFNIPFLIIQSNEGLILHKQSGIFDDSSLQLYF